MCLARFKTIANVPVPIASQQSSVPLPTMGRLLGLAWPTMLSRMSQTVIGLSDAILVAPLGGAALAATGTGAFNTFTVLILPLGIQFLVASFASQFHGRGEPESGKRFAWYGLMVAAATELLALATIPLVPKLLGHFHYEAEVWRLMSQYVQIRLLSAGAAIGIEGLSSYYGGNGRTRPGMVVNVAAMLLNVPLNWMLIHGHWGAPALGVAGSAIASCLVTWLAFFAFSVFFWRESGGRPKGLLLREFGKLLRFGIPEGLNFFFEFAAFAVFIDIVIASLGTASLAGTNAVFNVNSVSFMPAFGIGNAGAIIVGQLLGARRQDLVPRAVRLAMGATVTWMASAGFLAFVLAPQIMTLFAHGSDAVEVAAVGVQMLRLSAVWCIFDACAITLAESLRASGDTLFPLLARLSIAWLVFVPGAYISVHRWGWGAPGAAIWLVVYLALLAGALALRFRSNRWRKIDLLGPKAEVSILG